MAKEYNSKRAQLKHAQSLDEALSDIDYEMTRFSELVSALENRLKTGKANDSYSSMSTSELLTECKTFKTRLRSAITKLKGIDAENPSIPDYEEQYKELSKLLKSLSDQVGDLPLKKVSRKDNSKDDSEKEPSDSDMQKAYIGALIFSNKNVSELTKQLGQLSNKISTEFMEFSLTGDNYKLAKNKFMQGLLLLRTIDPENAMIKVYDYQIQEWDKIHNNLLKKRVLAWIGIAIGASIFFIYCANN